MTAYRIKQIETAYEGWRKIFRMSVEMPDGRTMIREVLNSGEAAAVLPYDLKRQKVILIRQFRAPVMHIEGHPDFLEAVAGLLDEDDPETCARRETMEEAGIRVATLEPVGRFWSAPGITTERLHLFLAPYAETEKVGEGGGVADEHEEIEVLEVGFDELADLAERNVIADLKTQALVQALQLRYPEHFRKA
ncbi:NUDIX domain-containing protein [Microvirga sp. P5_D2]